MGTTGGRCWAGPFIAAGVHRNEPVRGQRPPPSSGSMAWSTRSLDTAKTPPVPIAPGRIPAGARLAAPVEYDHLCAPEVANGFPATLRRDDCTPPLSTNSE